MFGGGSGASSKYILNPDGEAKELPSKVTLHLQPDSVISYRTPGGGGYGSALERDPERVLQDVNQGKVTPDRARDAYGVVLDASGKAVDLQATRAERTRLSGTPEPRG